MKQLLIDYLEVLTDEKKFIVKVEHYSKLKEGDVIFFNDLWCKWISGYLERTLVHIKLIIIQNDMFYCTTSSQHSFITKL